MKIVIYLAACFSILRVVFSSCHNDCNYHGLCNKHQQCECNAGWGGYDCTQRLCPTGPQLAGIANQTDFSHTLISCSGNGKCDTSTGQCVCRQGYTGINCARTQCMNDCSNRGTCLSLREAATYNDGYVFDRTTTYTRWDADTFRGCRCDPGWSGPDCSQRTCPYGPDPRVASTPYERVTLVCNCASSTCIGKFKLRFLGSTVQPWFKPTSYGYELANALMTVPGAFGNSSVYSSPPIFAANASYHSEDTRRVCIPYSTTKTHLYLLRTSLVPPAISFYANLITSGSLYFETKQVLQCDCFYKACNGTFRIAFDGEMSSRIPTWQNASSIITQLNIMSTMRAAGLTASAYDTGATKICYPGAITNYTIVLKGAYGNAPRIQLLSSVIASHSPTSYNTLNATASVLNILTSDGRDDTVKICNGIGACNLQTQECTCPFGWKPDPFYGPCGQLDVNSSTWGGLARCPGIIQAYSSRTEVSPELSGRQNYRSRLFVSFNAYHTANDGVEANATQSYIGYFDLRESSPVLLRSAERVSPVFYLNMSCNVSAGPLLVDEVNSYLFFLDLNPALPYIGRAPLDLDGGSTLASAYSWLTLTYYKINAFTMDAHWDHRKLYWTVPGYNYNADGNIYWAYMDAASPTAYSLTSTIGQSYVIDPSGIAIHYLENKIYWLDRVSASTHATRLLRCNRDGSGVTVVYRYGTIDGHTVSGNSSELFIDYRFNNTAFFMDTGNSKVVIATNLDLIHQRGYYNDTNTTEFFQYMNPVYIALNSSEESMKYPQRGRLLMDSNTSTLYWTDPGLKVMKFFQYGPNSDPLFNYMGNASGISFRAPPINNQPYVPHYPCGMAIDRGLGPPAFDDYLDCYGNGVCEGQAGNWTCTCQKGFFGDCQLRSCPTGPAWFHEPRVDEIAHDVEMECSNMGVCNRATGVCSCKPGFEGSACERTSCDTFENDIDGSIQTCATVGRCMSLRELASKAIDAYGQSDSLSYGSHPHDINTWDADRVFGCHADEYGYWKKANITNGVPGNMSCPFGNNLRLSDYLGFNATLGNYTYLMEIQQLSCFAASGYFTVTFRGQTSGKIYYDFTAFQMAEVLAATPTIGPVQVKTSGDSSTDPVCSSTGSEYVYIYFQGELGHLPLLTANTAALGEGVSESASVAISRIQAGSSDGLMECSGRGECNRNTGQCECWPHWTSSDGFGNKGTRADCGHNDVY